jgi:hypothetical protein
LVDADLERDAGSGRRLLEDHPERPAREEMVLLPRLLEPLQLVREVQHLRQLAGTPIRDLRE